MNADASTPAAVIVLALGVAFGSGCSPPASSSSPDVAAIAVTTWPAYGGDLGGQRHTTLATITPENVKRLAPAWSYRHGDVSDGHGAVASETAFENTPILVDGTLYFCTPFNRVIALDPASGIERWTYDPEIDLEAHYANQLVCRGVTFWRDEESRADTTCRDRIFTATNEARLIAIDATTGQVCPGFGMKITPSTQRKSTIMTGLPRPSGASKRCMRPENTTGILATKTASMTSLPPLQEGVKTSSSSLRTQTSTSPKNASWPS